MLPLPSRPRWLPDADAGESTFVGELLRRETVGGAVALVAAVVAVAWANLAPDAYHQLRTLELGPLDLEHWAADGALTLFFFVAGLELKRELLVGSLRRPAAAAVPVAAAVGGVAVPAVLFAVVNRGTGNLGGWAIPSATDIAFALAVLAVVGSHLPDQLRAFLLTLAVVDDVLVIVVIAVFYTDRLDLVWLGAAMVALAAYRLTRHRGWAWLGLPLGVLAWWCTHESGIHATVAGVALGLLTPVGSTERLAHRLTPLSAGVAVPFFALLSAGVGISLGGLTSPVALGVAAGLVLGKPVGVLGGAWLVTRFTRAELNPGIGWRDVVGLALVAGVGFTVALLVSDLSFADVRREEAKTAVLAGSVVSAVLAATVLGRRSRVHARRSGP